MVLENLATELVDKHLFPTIGHLAKMMDIDLPQDPDNDCFAIPPESLPATSLNSAADLCAACSGMTMESLDSAEGYVHSHDISQFIDLADRCPLCKLIRARICDAVKYHVQSRELINDAREAIERFVIFMAEQDLSLFRPTPLVLKLDKDWAVGHVEKYVVAGTICWSSLRSAVGWLQCWGRLILHTNADGDIIPLRSRGSEEDLLERLRDWLCLRETEKPNWSTTANNVPMPTRVLDLDAFQDGSRQEDDADIRLCETDGWCGSYITLSYCWGGYTSCRTLQANYKQRKDRILYHQLPPVFAQAVRVTRALGVRYLWIDSLCIVQDDAEDWQREAAAMSDTYWNTICRLAVNDCNNPTETFFPPKSIMSTVSVPNLVAPEKAADDEHAQETSYCRGDGTDVSSHVLAEDSRPESSSREAANFEPAINMEDQDELVRKPLLPEHDGPSQESDEMDTMTDRFFRNFTKNLAASNEEYKRNPPKNKPPTEAYLTTPKAYSIDVDRGILNTRAWVLQERLLAPRTIHFTKDHIYCEDQDDLCGEDWVKQYFTWMSCVNKTSEQRRAGLLPQATNVANVRKGKGKESDKFNVWFQRSLYDKPESQRIAYPWLRICEKFSKCHLTYRTDRLAALSGLVKQCGMLRSQEQAEMKRNFLGLWEDDMHEQLAWVGRVGYSIRLLEDLNMPSWAWIAYDGPIWFLDQTPHFSENIRDSVLPRNRPSKAFHLHHADVPEMMTQLPLKRPASLTLKCKLRRMFATYKPAVDKLNQGTRQQLALKLPFHFDPRTETVPKLLLGKTKCYEILEKARTLIGFVSFDEDVQIATEILYLHVSTLFDQADSYAMRELDKPGVSSVDMEAFQEPIMAYALAVTKIRDCPDGLTEYRRVGFAEVNYNWITDVQDRTIRLV
ncbi:MAG: hypothetical protein Q9198_002107 [Flavoplaca austrocitrina]